jgi:hypothetical protein
VIVSRERSRACDIQPCSQISERDSPAMGPIGYPRGPARSYEPIQRRVDRRPWTTRVGHRPRVLRQCPHPRLPPHRLSGPRLSPCPMPRRRSTTTPQDLGISTQGIQDLVPLALHPPTGQRLVSQVVTSSQLPESESHSSRANSRSPLGAGIVKDVKLSKSPAAAIKALVAQGDRHSARARSLIRIREPGSTRDSRDLCRSAWSARRSAAEFPKSRRSTEN